MTVLAGDLLYPAPWSKRLSHHWRGLELSEVARIVAESAGFDGLVLPYTRVDGRPAFPLVTVNSEVAVKRLSSRQGPMLDRAVLRDHAAAAFVDAPPEAVALSGFVTVDPFAEVRRHLVGLRTWAPTAAAVPSWRPLDPFSAAQCDYYDHRVFVCDGKTASELHAKSWAGQPKVRRGDAWARLRDEQMFQLALETGLVASVANGSLRR